MVMSAVSAAVVSAEASVPIDPEFLGGCVGDGDCRGGPRGEAGPLVIILSGLAVALPPPRSPKSP